MSRRQSHATEKALAFVAGGKPIAEAARLAGVNRSTLFRALQAREVADAGPSVRTLICGAGALGRELAQWMRAADPAAVIAFLDDGVGKTPAQLTAAGIVGPIDRDSVAPGDSVLIAIADPQARWAMAYRLVGPIGEPFIDPSSLHNGNRIGPGSILLPHTLLSEGVTLGSGVILNTYSSVGHDCSIDDFCTLASYVCLSGRVTVGKRVSIGSHAQVLPGLSIGDDAVIGAGAVVIKDVPAGAKVFGNPARAIA